MVRNSIVNFAVFLALIVSTSFYVGSAPAKTNVNITLSQPIEVAVVEKQPVTPVDRKMDILTVDLEYLVATLPKEVSEAEFTCLAQAIYFEARSEPHDGQMAVAGVILNRTKSKRYPNNICGVVFQNDHRRNLCQFSFACDGRSDTARNAKAWDLSKRIAVAVLTKQIEDMSKGATHYHADYVSPRWAKSMQPTVNIGLHQFYNANI